MRKGWRSARRFDGLTLCVNNYRGGGDGVSMPGAAIAEIMRQHRSDAEVQAAGCEALDQIISDEALGIGTAAAVSLIVAVLRRMVFVFKPILA